MSKKPGLGTFVISTAIAFIIALAINFTLRLFGGDVDSIAFLSFTIFLALAYFINKAAFDSRAP